MNYLASLDSSRDLQFVCAKSFVNRFYLVLQISKIPTQNFFAPKLNTALVPTSSTCLWFRVGCDARPSLMYADLRSVGHNNHSVR